MSVELCKFDSGIDNHSFKMVFNKPLASQRIYNEYLWPAIQELNIVHFRECGRITKSNLDVVMSEIDLLIKWVKVHSEGSDQKYLLSRLESMKEIIPEKLEKDDDVLEIC